MKSKKEKLPIQDAPFIGMKTFLYKCFVQEFVKIRNSRKNYRMLEIGPGSKRLDGFEGLNIVKNKATDYIADVAKGIPFSDNTFNLIYTSHFLEHIEWYKTKFVLSEIYRVLRWGGALELWVPNGLKIAKAFVDAELNNSKDFEIDNWWRFNEKHDPCVWANGRIFTYGNGKVIKGHWNSHLALFSERYLKDLLSEIGFKNILPMDDTMLRDAGHGFINMGIKACK